jgi:glyoxylase-like metal-dependent hydrolase (beta-lactamase superfamily II)
VLLTHLHTDHAGGLHHFPKAEILVSRKEYAATAGFSGQLAGYLRQRWPSWFKPRLVDYNPSPVGPFPQSLALTKAGDVLLVPTEGHSVGHQSVIVNDGDTSFFFAGDTSYTERLMLDQAIDGVSPDETVARATLERVKQFVLETPAVYLPSHDPDAAQRLAMRTIAPASAARSPGHLAQATEW